MDAQAQSALANLVRSRASGALGTMHEGAPMVSFVLCSVAPDGSEFHVLVSGLSAHTQDMRADGRVSLMISASEEASKDPQSLPRLTIQGDAIEIPRNSESYSRARDSYLKRHPQSAGLFNLGDFAMFGIRPRSLRFVAGFARAFSLQLDSFQRALREGAR
jgi:putative heme iron utilization protein